MKSNTSLRQILKLVALAAVAPASLSAQSLTLNQTVSQDTYVSSDSPTGNFGSLGAMEIAASTSAQPRTQESLIQFATTAFVAGFNGQFGVGNWTITSVTLKLFSNFNTANTQPNNTSFNVINPGTFQLDWLSNDSWNENTMTWNTLPSVLPGTGNNSLASLGNFFWQANGAANTTWTLGLNQNLVGDISSGDPVTIFGQPEDNTVGYLFNTKNNNPAVLSVTAQAIPEPSALALGLSGLAGMASLKKWKQRA